ncbi:DUF3095 family protein [Pedobacter sp. Du54]|uniref:DUF3095 family protein n=1 Tax=Pedobacter anseongensis TaxID=3133439 RepID=UPI0030ACF774
MSKNNHNFYEKLPITQIELSKLLLKDSAFSAVPADWHVVITDIKGSTAAVADGFNETVNFIATGSIVAVLNLAFKAKIPIPFFFGGDGATFIMPSILIELALKKLTIFRKNTLQNFNIDLRVGTVAVSQVYDAGHHIHISKFAISDFFSIPVVLGNGLSYAENVIKAEDYALTKQEDLIEELDLNGMQCRWDKIAPPENVNEVITLLVISPKIENQAKSFSKVMKHIDEIYGGIKKRQPISVDKLKFNSTFRRMRTELSVRIGKIKFLELVRNWLINSFGPVYFLTSNGKKYLNRLVETSDTLVLDGKINTVICGNEQQRMKLVGILDELEKNSEILYGLYISSDSVMSCYVRDLKDDHIHFVDGADGGYTQAAKMLKAKLVDYLAN